MKLKILIFLLTFNICSAQTIMIWNDTKSGMEINAFYVDSSDGQYSTLWDDSFVKPTKGVVVELKIGDLKLEQIKITSFDNNLHVKITKQSFDDNMFHHIIVCPYEENRFECYYHLKGITKTRIGIACSGKPGPDSDFKENDVEQSKNPFTMIINADVAKALNLETNTTAHKILDISESAKASEINAAWKKMQLKFHPDKNQDKTDLSNEVIKVINKARDILLIKLD